MPKKIINNQQQPILLDQNYMPTLEEGTFIFISL